MPDMMDAFGTVRTGIDSSRARITRSVCVVALRSLSASIVGGGQHPCAYPKGSPTTRKATSSFWALRRISSLFDSTISRSAIVIERP